MARFAAACSERRPILSQEELLAAGRDRGRDRDPALLRRAALHYPGILPWHEGRRDRRGPLVHAGPVGPGDAAGVPRHGAVPNLRPSPWDGRPPAVDLSD